MVDAFKMVMNHGPRLHPRNLGLLLDHAMGPDIFVREECELWLNHAAISWIIAELRYREFHSLTKCQHESIQDHGQDVCDVTCAKT